MTHISYECAKRLKEFLGESAPEPMCHEYFTPSGDVFYRTQLPRREKEFPMYRLHDLLSKPFCEAMAERKCPLILTPSQLKAHEMVVFKSLTRAWYGGGLPAVEAALMEMMEEK